MSQEFLGFYQRVLLAADRIATLTVRIGVAPGAYPGPRRRTGSEAMAE